VYQPDWAPNSHSLALGAELVREKISMQLILNAYWEPLDFELPPVPNGGTWRRWIDTALDSPRDIVDWKTAEPVAGESYRAGARSVVVLIAGEVVGDEPPAGRMRAKSAEK
jgi:glycogen operon protein